ncbi:MAG: M15 family metallopeptidase [Campylobacterales bacterium]|nr:M15 family metallopeptidase [Campylobacterales bacterium]
MSLVSEQNEFLKDVAKLIEFCAQKGFIITGGELYRTEAQQSIYLKEGKSKTSNSMHLKRLAIDLNFFVNGALSYDKTVLSSVGAFWESLNPKNRWGGNFSTLVDTPHFERYIA